MQRKDGVINQQDARNAVRPRKNEWVKVADEEEEVTAVVEAAAEVLASNAANKDINPMNVEVEEEAVEEVAVVVEVAVGVEVEESATNSKMKATAHMVIVVDSLMETEAAAEVEAEEEVEEAADEEVEEGAEAEEGSATRFRKENALMAIDADFLTKVAVAAAVEEGKEADPVEKAEAVTQEVGD